MEAAEQTETRYSNGGDEWILVQLAEGMSVGVNMRALAICRRLEEQRLEGVLDICPSNASYLVRLDPDELHPRALEEDLRRARGRGRRRRRLPPGDTDRRRAGPLGRPVDARGRPAVPRPASDARPHRHRVRGPAERLRLAGGIQGHRLRRPVPRNDDRLRPGPDMGLPARRPRTARSRSRSTCGPAPTRQSSPSRGAAHSRPSTRSAARAATSCWACARRRSSTRPACCADFRDRDWFFRAGDIIRYRSVDRSEYDRIRASVEDGSFTYATADVEFIPRRWYDDPGGVTASLERSLDGA